ncbi:MAG: LuxR C-terminal-related transcriptional regulator [Treponemataceae bacterium]|nr:LuxR C-terminal-related transcriptional regulator [Treponemataceae bacterium]
MTKSVILVDDHAVLRNGRKNWIENNSDFRVKFEAGTYSECAEILKKLEQAVHGAKGFVSKVADEKVLLDALNAVTNGGTYIQAELVKGLLEVRDITQTFSKREKIIAEAITLYNTNADIASALGISEKTVVNFLRYLGTGRTILGWHF